MSLPSNCEANGLHQLKLQAAEYYSLKGPANGVIEHMEELLNSMFYDNPEDIYGHLASYFENLAQPPVISQLFAREVIDSRGLPTLQTDVYCKFKNQVKLITTFESATSDLTESLNVDDKDMVSAEREKSMDQAVDLINNSISVAISNMSPFEQAALDDVTIQIIAQLQCEYEAKKKADEEAGVVEHAPVSPSASRGTKDKSVAAKVKGKGPAVSIVPDEPPEPMLPGSFLISAVSQALCQSGAILANLPLYEHIAQCVDQCQAKEIYRLPMPMMTIMTSGRTSPGKMNCIKEFIVIPAPTLGLDKALKSVGKIYNHCARTIGAKVGGGRNCSDNGGLCPTFDRPEQGLDLMLEAITQLGLSPGKDFYLAINCAGQEIFDYNSGKYEVIAGQQKTAEELTKFWLDIVTRYPSIIALIDPMRKQDKEQWMKLCEDVSKRCYIVGDHVYHRPGILKDEELAVDFKTSAIVLHLENMNTISDVWCCIMKMEEVKNQIVISSSLGDACNSVIVDLAVACNAKFIKIGGPVRGEKTCKLNRLLQIKAQLELENRLADWDELEFTFIEAPPPPPPPPVSPTVSPSPSVIKKK